MSDPSPGTRPMNDDERLLAELGYKQELERSWGGFTNFAISFSIISILAGCFTNFFAAWNNGGPPMVSIGWPVVSVLILIVAFCMAEILSSMPTAGGIYYWASKLGGPRAGWFTGWFNLIGLVGVVASVDYACASFISYTIGLFDTSYDAFNLKYIFLIFLCVLAIHVLLNLFPAHILSIWNNSSAYWHVVGATAIVLILIFGPSSHQSASFVFTHWVNNSGFSGGTSSAKFFLYVVPLGVILTQYTITGFDASAHMSEETTGAAKAAARGMWQSVFYSAIGGWILLLCFLFAVKSADTISLNNPYGAGQSIGIFATAPGLGLAAFKAIMIISSVGQFFCGGSGLTSASRMMYAFSRDRAVPGHQLWSKVAANRAPRNATLAMATICAIVTLPALYGNAARVPIAFYALASITVVGLYIAYIIPVFLRWRMGDSFVPGPWTLGSKYKWMCPVAVIEVVVVCIIAFMPTSPLGIPGQPGFAWNNGAINYCPIIVGLVALYAWLSWSLWAKNWFKGPVRTIDLPDDGGPTTPAAATAGD
ncbi:MAG TPA: amino acid permease [Gaiellales bacterium]|nr:amino acid permease [Gaiellales bacterium]